MEQVHRQHAVLVVIAEHVGIVPLGRGDALALLQLLDGRNKITISGRALILLPSRSLLHARVQRTAQVGGPSLQKQLHVAHRLLVELRRGQILHTRSQAALNVVLQARPRMKTGQVDLARRNQKIAVDQIDDPVCQVGREIRTVVRAPVLAQSPGHVDPRPALAQRQLHVGVSLVIPQQDVEARLALLDQIVFQRQRLFVVRDDDVIHIDCLAHQGPRLGVLPTPFVKVAGYAAAQILRLPHVNHIALGVLVQIHSGFGGNGADFGEKIHAGASLYFTVSRHPRHDRPGDEGIVGQRLPPSRSAAVLDERGD